MSEPVISVVIGTYNQKEVLKKTLDSLFRQSLPPSNYEIVLIDSSSTDGTDQMATKFMPICRLKYLRVANRGKSYARNTGIKEAKGKIILLTDADMEAHPELLNEHRLAHEKKLNASFEGTTINPDGKPYIKQRLKAGQRLKWAYFLTGNLSIAKKQLLEAGLFDENFRGYGWEDLELGYRLHRMGIKLYYLPSAINYHHHPVSNEDLIKRKYEMGKSAAYFYKKHPAFEIKMFLGLNPLAMGIFHWLKKHPPLVEKLKAKSATSSFSRYLLEEYYYRLGLTEELT